MNATTHSLRKSVAAAAVIACGFQFLTLPAFADGASAAEKLPTQHIESSATSSAPQKIVFFGDLDISKPAGVKILIARISGAVKQVCGDSGTRDLARSQVEKQCRAESFANAMVQVRTATRSELVASR
jgi:UrcA family protein